MSKIAGNGRGEASDCGEGCSTEKPESERGRLRPQNLSQSQESLIRTAGTRTWNRTAAVSLPQLLGAADQTREPKKKSPKWDPLLMLYFEI